MLDLHDPMDDPDYAQELFEADRSTWLIMGPFISSIRMRGMCPGIGHELPDQMGWP
jgi:hypothetical protein